MFHSSHLGLQKREQEISTGGVLGAGRTGGAAALPGSRHGILLEPEPKHSSAPHELLYGVKHEKSPYTIPPAPQNLPFAAQLWTSTGKSHSAGNPREARSPGTPAERRFGQIRCLLRVINFSKAAANSRGGFGRQPASAKVRAGAALSDGQPAAP